MFLKYLLRSTGVKNLVFSTLVVRIGHPPNQYIEFELKLRRK